MRTESWDLRLVPAAVLGWLVSIAALNGMLRWLPLSVLMIIAGLGIVGAVLARFIARPFSGSPHLPATLRWIFISLAAAGIIGLSALASQLVKDSGPLAESAQTRATVSATVLIESDPSLRTGTTRGLKRGADQWQVRARLESLHIPHGSAQGSWSVGAPLLVNFIDLAHCPPPGTLVQVTGRLSRVDWTPQYAAALTVAEPPALVAAPDIRHHVINAIRDGLRSSVSGVAPDAGALVLGLTVGDESIQPEALGESMRVSGLSHLTAVSGGNIAILVGVIIMVGRLVGSPVVVRAVFAGAAVVGYVLIVGPEPSVLRAAGMGTVSVMAILGGGTRRGMSSLAATIVVLLIIAPPLALSLGFSLSVAATAGLLVISPPLRRTLLAALNRGGLRSRPRLRTGLADAIALTGAAQIATAPLLAALGDGLSMVAVPANVLAAPAVAPVTVLGLLAAMSAPLVPPLGAAFAHVAAPPAAWIAFVAHVLADVPVATLPWPGGLVGAAAITVALAIVMMVIRVARQRHWPLRTAAVAALVCAVVLVMRPPDRAGWPPPDWIGVACDVGQGDAFVIATGPGSAIVVDSGPNPDDIQRCLDSLGIHHVNALVLTHFHADHVEGTPGVMAGRDIGVVVTSPLREPLEQVERVEDWVIPEGIPLQVATAGEERQVSEDVTWRVLWPGRIIKDGSIPNNASVVLHVIARGVHFLLLGDVEPAAQVAIRSGSKELQIDVVKVAHHGSRFQDPRFPDWSAGRIAVLSVGADNDYGHPAPETVAAWEYIGADVVRTDTAGDIAFVVRSGELGTVTRRS
jgi:competence protein ComEC